MRSVVSAFFVLVLGGCQSYPWVERPDQRVGRTRIDEVILTSANTDILFVVDNSGSMGEEQANLIANTTVFIEELAQSDNAYRVGVITTDPDDNADGGRLRLERASAGELSNAGCSIGVDSSPQDYLERPALEDPESDAKRCRLVQDFVATITSIGTGGSGREAGLMLARDAMAGTLNPDFIRPEADLALIFLTDEDDCSFDDYGGFNQNSSCYEEIADAIAVNSLVDEIVAIKGDSVTKVRAAAIIGGVVQGDELGDFIPRGCHLDDDDSASSDCGCWSSSDNDFFCELLVPFGHGCPSTAGCGGQFFCSADGGGACDTARCDALPGSRYHDFVAELRRRRRSVGFSGGTFEDSICQAQYDETLLTIARTVVLSNCFNLDVESLGPDTVELSLTRTYSDGTQEEFALPWLDASDPGAGCSVCGDCPDGAFSVPNPSTVCLECGLLKQVGDAYVLTVLNEVKGSFDDEVTP